MSAYSQSDILGDKNTWLWGLRALRAEPLLVAKSVGTFCTSRLGSGSTRQQFVLCAHHKVLSTFFSRVLHGYAFVTNASISKRKPGHGDYSADIIFDNHSRIEIDKLKPDAVGLHLRRDPRDMVVSSAFYHQKSVEKWLHKPRKDFNGMTYQEKIKSLPTMEDRMLFEIDHSTGDNIADMQNWLGHPRILDIDYAAFVGPHAATRFCETLDKIEYHDDNRAAMINLFKFFSIDGGARKFTPHIRDPRPDQWKDHFTPKTQAYFDQKFRSLSSTLKW